MACDECPETPDTGCLQNITTECVTYNGEDVTCADISSGQSLNQVIEQLGNNDCDIKELIEDINQDIEELSGSVVTLQTIVTDLGDDINIDLDDIKNDINDINEQLSGINSFTCEDLSGCTLDELSDADYTHVSGDVLMSDGSKWINYTLTIPEQYEFSCEDLSGCTLDDLGNVIETASAAGDSLLFNGTNWVNQPFSSLFSASNGLTKSGINTKLGGTLTENTNIVTSTYTLSVSKDISSGINTSYYPLYAANSIKTGGSETTKTAKACYSGALGIDLTSNLTPYSAGYKHGVFSGTIYKGGTFNWLGKLPVYFAEQEHYSSGDTTWAIAYLANPPSQYGAGAAFTGTITNAVGLYIEDINASNITSKITNKYAIYQKGASDISIFFGEVQNAGGVTQFTSDARIKENIQEYTRGLSEIEQINTKTFNYTYKKDKPLVGIIAQELENIIPEAVKQGNFETPEGESYSDFRMIDQNYLIYTLINAVKELSQKVKTLENGIE